MKLVRQLEVKNIWNEKELYPTDKAIFACKKCNSYEIESDGYKCLSSQMERLANNFSGYINYYLASRHAGDPKYNFVFLDFKCSKCNEDHSAFFYTRFQEQYFPKDAREFFLADINGRSLEETIDGVYSRNTCQIFMKKLFIRWHILKNITYIVVPFVGNPRQSAEQRLNLLGELLGPLHPFNTLWITRHETIAQIKADIETDLGKGSFEALDDSGQIHPVVKSAFKKKAFHAKFYCGISDKGVEVLVGSHNLHGGASMENILFKNYNLDKFIERYMMQINVVPVKPPNSTTSDALIFDRQKGSTIDKFINNASDLLLKYNH